MERLMIWASMIRKMALSQTLVGSFHLWTNLKKRNIWNKKMIKRWMEEKSCARMRRTLGKFWYQNLLPKRKKTKRFLNSCPFGERKRKKRYARDFN
ncbi:hypothetical protein BDE02_10G123100 [Populus trichocarpa]|nr:hypothetical protein BDE02_10G123100 [Populus trichocarpa]KAI5574085.1 hypothetical protein BDE02_10G123100 [Populus trichocarpa]